MEEPSAGSGLKVNVPPDSPVIFAAPEASSQKSA